MQGASRVGVHLIEERQNFRHARLTFRGCLRLRDQLGWSCSCGFCHTENITVSRQKLLLLVAGVVAFGLSLAGSFHFDDYALFDGNVLRTLWTRPLSALTYWVSIAIGDRNPVDYHAVNLALHLMAVLLLFNALRQLISERAAFIASLLFAVHPMQAEAVNYVFARSSELDTVLCIAALASWGRGRRWWAVAWFAGALAAKEECVSFPIFLFLLDLSLGQEKRDGRDGRDLKPIVAMLLLAVAAGITVLIAVERTPGVGAGSRAGVSVAQYLVAQGPVILRYLRLLVVPWGFTVDAGIAVPPLWMGVVAWLGVTALAGLAALHFTRLRAGFWFIGGLVLLLPSSSIFPAEDLAADRRMYLPMIAFAACAGLLMQYVRMPVVAAIVVVLAGLSIQRTMVWRTEQELWTDAVEKAPEKVRPKIQLARAVSESDPMRSLDLLKQAEGLAPDDPRIASEEGRVYLSIRQYPQALGAFGRALALEPGNADALNNRGAALLALRQNDAARQDFERALAINPCQRDARANLARLGVNRPTPASCP